MTTNAATTWTLLLCLIAAASAGAASEEPAAAEAATLIGPPPTIAFYEVSGCPICAKINSWLDALDAEHPKAALLVRQPVTKEGIAAEMEARGIEHHGVAILNGAGELVWNEKGVRNHFPEGKRCQEPFPRRKWFLTPFSQAASALRLLAVRQRVIAEGAGALPLAAALASSPALADLGSDAKICCVVSGGNIDAPKLATILGGGVP